MRIKKPKQKEKVYVFRISLKQGRADKYKDIWRDIEILESHSLYQFANAITDAYGFYFDHPFGFFSKLEWPFFDSPVKYELFTDLEDVEPTGALSVKKTKIKQALKKIGDKMLFLFDYGDNWYFHLELLEIKKPDFKTKYPLTVKSFGKAPDQYPPLNELDEEGGEDFEEFDSENPDPQTKKLKEAIEKTLEKLGGSPSQEEIDKVISNFENKGLSGQIIAVPDEDSKEAENLMEYIQFHKYLKEKDYQNLSNQEIKKYVSALKSRDTDLFEKRKIIMALGHSGKLKAYKALGKYLKKAPEELVFWTGQAFGECKMFLEAGLLEKPKIDFKEFTENK